MRGPAPTYLRDVAPEALVTLATIALVGCALGLCGVDGGVIQLVVLTLLLGEVIRLVLGYLRRRPVLCALWRLGEDGGEGPGAASRARELGPMHTGEGRLLARALDAVVLDGHDELVRARRDAAEYRDYIELWGHEIKTPLAAIALMGANHPGELWDLVAPEVDRIGRNVDQALFLARSYGVARDYLVRPVALVEVVRAAVRDRMRLLMEADAAISLRDLDVTVHTDTKWMVFILTQLIDNAVKYVRPGERPSLTFSARLEEEGGARERVVLCLTDQGLGIPAHDLGRVFDKGFVGERGRAPGQVRSTGMGLHLVRTLCTRMGLGVAIDSDGASWTSVSIIFPRDVREGGAL